MPLLIAVTNGNASHICMGNHPLPNHVHVLRIAISINPRRMREGYGSCSVCVCVLSVCVSVCLSVTVLATTYLVCKSKVRCYEVPYGVSNLCIVWISLKTLCSPVLMSFAYSLCPPRSLKVLDGQNKQHWALFKIQSV